MTKPQAVPEGFRSLTPFLYPRDTAALLDFLKQAFGATQTALLHWPDGRVMHAAMRVGDSMLMLSDACDQMSPMPTALYLYVEDVDAVYRRALDAGATSFMEPADMFWGDRMGGVKDPANNLWWIATHVEDVPDEQIPQRARAFIEQNK